jgi:hypothetical protein
MDEKPADSARVQRFVIPPMIVTRNWFSVNNERARPFTITIQQSKHQDPFAGHAAREAIDVPSKLITRLRCTFVVFKKRSGITVELTRRRESKHPSPHEAS